MPLIRLQQLGADARLGLWQMTEDAAALPVPPEDLSRYHSASRLRERLTAYALLREMTGRADLVIDHDETGRPLVDGWNISISHTRGWAALIQSRSKAVAVDIEFFSDRVSRVRDRFVRPDEDGDSLACQLINWSAKETVYKLLGRENLQYFEMRLLPFVPAAQGRVVVEDLKHPRRVEVDYELNGDFVLTHAVD